MIIDKVSKAAENAEEDQANDSGLVVLLPQSISTDTGNENAGDAAKDKDNNPQSLMGICQTGYVGKEVFGRSRNQIDQNHQSLPSAVKLFREKLICFLFRKEKAHYLFSIYFHEIVDKNTAQSRTNCTDQCTIKAAEGAACCQLKGASRNNCENNLEDLGKEKDRDSCQDMMAGPVTNEVCVGCQKGDVCLLPSEKKEDQEGQQR